MSDPFTPGSTLDNDTFTAIRPAVLDWQAQTPVAREFDDPYFSRQNGLAESEYVFLHGNELPARFAALRDGERFAIGETGFGTGLNMLLAAELFLAQAPAGARLDLFSVEKHPLTRADLAQALSHWPSLAAPAQTLLDQYPPACPGFHRLWLAPNVALTLMFGDATALWEQCSARIDAWFLDGFAPARNPDMWQPPLFATLARHSRPGATLATFTAAGFVRRGLAEAGFVMRKIDGFGDKRHMLTGHFGGPPATETRRPCWGKEGLGQECCGQECCGQECRGQALIAGAGLAGSTTARALAERGWQVTVLDPLGIANGASGNLAGVVYSTPSPHLTAQNRFYQNSYLHALRWLHRHAFPRTLPQQGNGALNGVVQHYVDEKQRDKIRQASASGVWPGELLEAGERQATLHGGGYINPPAWCAHLLDHPSITVRKAGVVQVASGTPATVTLDDGQYLQADAVVIATADAARTLLIDGVAPSWLPLKRIRGQVSYCRATAASRTWQQARCHGGYLTPALDGLHCVGATFDLHRDDSDVCDEDDQANLAQLGNFLPEQWQELGGEHIEVVDRRVAFRCQSNDFLPLAGAFPDPHGVSLDPLPGLWLNIAHGSRGITGTPLCAEILADRISNAPPPADQELLDALDPARFIRRRRRKQATSPL